jgi:hypothetical protein
MSMTEPAKANVETIGDLIRANQIERGAKALREHQMAGRITLSWANVPRSQKKKWLEAAAVVIDAADRST